MRRAKRRLFNLFAFSLLAFAIYLNFFYKEEHQNLLRSQPAEKTASKNSGDLTTKPTTAVKK
jgi:hypothetical protein